MSTEENAIVPHVAPSIILKPRSIFSMTQEHVDRLKLIASMHTNSAFNKSSKLTQEEALLIMFKGCEIGLEPMAALDLMDVISGNITLKPQGMLAMIYARQELEDMQINEDDDSICIVTMKRKGKSPITESFSLEDARNMKTREDGKTISLIEKYNWRQMPKVMMKWRAISKCARIVFPDIIQGMYPPEEIDPDVSFDTGIIPDNMLPETVSDPLVMSFVEPGTYEVAKIVTETGKNNDTEYTLIGADGKGLAKEFSLGKLTKGRVDYSALREIGTHDVSDKQWHATIIKNGRFNKVETLWLPEFSTEIHTATHRQMTNKAGVVKDYFDLYGMEELIGIGRYATDEDGDSTPDMLNEPKLEELAIDEEFNFSTPPMVHFVREGKRYIATSAFVDTRHKDESDTEKVIEGEEIPW